MPTPLETLVSSGTKLWLDSIDPDLVLENRHFGATGATSNPIIISDLLKTGRFDSQIVELAQRGLSDADIAWTMTDRLVRQAQEVFAAVHAKTKGNDGYVSFELDPLLEAAECTLSVNEKAARYVELGKQWAKGQVNRMIKVPGTPGGLAALEELAAAGITLNVTLLFSKRQYEIARDAIWRGAATIFTGRIQIRLQHLRQSNRRVHEEARSRLVGGRTGSGRDRQCPAFVERESAILG